MIRLMIRSLLLAACLLLARPVLADPQSDLVWDAAAQQSLEQARAEFRQANQVDLPAGGPALEQALERQHLLAQTVTLLEQERDQLHRLDDARKRVGEQVARTRAWNGFDTPPPYSILMVDRIRQALATAQSQADAATSRAALLNQAIDESAKDLSDADVAMRQAEEKSATPAAGKAPDDWTRERLRLRARAAAATMNSARSALMLAQAEAAEQQSLAELYQKQLAVVLKHSTFSQQDLDGVLADLDKQRDQLEERLRQSQLAVSSARNALAEAQRQQAAFKNSNGSGNGNSPAAAAAARQALLSQTVELRRLQADNADLRRETIQHILEALDWKRASWQLRWTLVNSHDADKREDALQRINQLISRLQSWNRYIQDEYLRSRRMGDETAPTPGDLNRAQKLLTKDMRDAYVERSETLSDTEQAVGDLLRTLTLWREDYQAQTRAGEVGDWLRAAAAAVRHTLVDLWNFELLTAEDTLEVDGRKIVAVRSVTVGKSIGVVVLVILGALVSRRVIRAVRGLAVKRLGASASHAATVGRWAQLLATTLMVLVALYATNIPLTVFTFLGGALAIGVGFGTQNLLKNMISGIMLLVERPLRVGDIVEVGNVVGTVTHINIRSSTVRTNDGIEVLVPNSTFIENNVTNWTYSTAQVRRTVSVGVDYDADPQRVAELLKAVATCHAMVSQNPEPQVLLSDFGSDALQFTLRYWIDYADNADASAIASDLRFRIVAVLSQAGIGIPYPQRVVHLKQG